MAVFNIYNSLDRKMTASQNNQGIRTDRQRKRDRDLRIEKSELACMSCTV